jgi:Bacterial protein of unknown function (DUF882)
MSDKATTTPLKPGSIATASPTPTKDTKSNPVTLIDTAGKPILKSDGKPYLLSETKLAPLLGADKKPVMGSDGKPATTILDPSGNPILGPDKKPIVVNPKQAEEASKLKSDESAIAKKTADSEGGRMAYVLKITIGDLEFSNLKGDFLGTPVLTLSTRQVGEIDFLLNELASDQNQLPKAESKEDKDPKASTSAPAIDPNNPAKIPATPPATPIKPGTIPPVALIANQPVKEDPKSDKSKDSKDPKKSNPVTLLDVAGKPILKSDGKPYLLSETKLVPLMGADKKPVMGPDGKPATTLLDVTGNPVLGADKKPIVVNPKQAEEASKLQSKDDASKPGDVTPEDSSSLWSKIKAQEGAEVKIESGFPPLIYTKLTGKCYRIGRRMPDGIVLEVVDMSTAAQSTAPTITNSTDPNNVAANAQVPDEPVLGPDKKPVLKPDGKPYLTSEAKPLLDANKKPVLGPDGKPVLTILDSAGNPVLDANKKPIVVIPKPVIPTPAPTTNTTTETTPIAPVTAPATAQTIPPVSIPPKSQAAAITAAATSNSKIAPTMSAQTVAKDSGLNFEKKTDAGTGVKGSIGVNESALSTAVKDAAKQGDVVIVDGNTIKQVAPGEGTPTGLILDWNQHKSIFIRKPIVMKKTPNHLASGTGIMAVQGWDVNGKQSVGGFAVVPGQFTPVPGGKINVPEWGTLKMSDPIFPGCFYTWGDATKEGNRVPHAKSVIQGIIEIAQYMMQLHSQGMGGNKKALITSWYRDPATNSQFKSGSAGPHTKGCAIDFYFDGYMQYYNTLEKTWEGGLAYSTADTSGEFMHIDLGGISETFVIEKRRRWSY